MNEAPDPSNDRFIQKPSPAESPAKSWIEIVEEGKDDEIKRTVSERITDIISSYGLETYLTLLLFDPRGTIGDLDLNRLYKKRRIFFLSYIVPVAVLNQRIS